MADDDIDPAAGGDGGGDGGEADKPPEWQAPTRDEWDKVQAALGRANKEAKERRTELDKIRQAGEKPDEKAIREAQETAAREADARWKPRYVATAAREALVAAGLRGAPDRLLRLIDSSTVEVADDGTLSGLDTQVAALKKDYPEFFGRPSSREIDGGDRAGSGGGKKMTSAERMAAQLLGAPRQ